MAEKVVWKHKLSLKTPTLVPFGQVLLVAEQRGELCAWVQHSSNPGETLELVIFATGQLIPDSFTSVGSIIDGDFIWHVHGRMV